MAVLHRALFTWFNILIFLILLVLRLDQRIQWNWFIVFIPMWLYDNILLIYVIFNMVSHCKNVRTANLRREVNQSQIIFRMTIKSVCWLFFQTLYLNAVLLKLSAQILLCLKLEIPQWNLPAKVILSPYWVLIPALAIDTFIHLIQYSRY